MKEGFTIIEQIKLPSDFKALVEVENLVDRVCNGLGIQDDAYGNVLIAVTEAVNNAIRIELKEINLNLLIENLSPREREVYKLLLKGHNNQELIDKLHLSLPTVKQYKSEVMRKLNVKSLSKLIELAK